MKQARLFQRNHASLRCTCGEVIRKGRNTTLEAHSSRQTTAISSSGSSSSSSNSNSSSSNSRRQALLGLLSTSLASQAAAAAAWAKPALLDLPACRKFKQAGPIGFCELKQGSGDSPLPGDLIIVDYTARAVANDNEVYDGSRNFKFTIGNGEMIPGS
uniref:peptidylprolyl isomerase n=1 Tax=Tetradesmus obliquus TaxID=3088 RepID=A0A383WJX4_TETOB|eukprot:jgi/Sobl393_1/19592/SZX77046.1